MSAKKTVLMIAPFTALPLSSGGRMRIFHTINQLHKRYRLTVWSFVLNKQEELLQKNYLKKLAIPAHFLKLKTKHFLSFLLSGQPYWFSDWYSQEAIAKLRMHGASFSHVQIESTQLLYLVSYVPKNSTKIFVAYDVSTISFWRRLRVQKNWFKKFLHFVRFLEVYLYERKYLSQFDIVVAVSKHDARFLKLHFGLRNSKVIENGIEKITFLPPRKKITSLRLGYIGSFAHSPNFLAVQFLLKEVLPILEKKGVIFEFYMAGQNDLAALNALIDESSLKDKTVIKNLGYLDEAKDFYKQIDLLVAPIFTGSGTRVKILESLSYGRPVLTTKVGVEGLSPKLPLLKVLPSSMHFNGDSWVKEIQNLVYVSKNWKKEKAILKKELEKITWKKIFEKGYATI